MKWKCCHQICMLWLNDVFKIHHIKEKHRKFSLTYHDAQICVLKLSRWLMSNWWTSQTKQKTLRFPLLQSYNTFTKMVIFTAERPWCQAFSWQHTVMGGADLQRGHRPTGEPGSELQRVSHQATISVCHFLSQTPKTEGDRSGIQLHPQEKLSCLWPLLPPS